MAGHAESSNAHRAYYYVDGQRTSVVASVVETWPPDKRQSTEFFCIKCKVPVKPWNMRSKVRSATFSPSPHSHTDDCGEIISVGTAISDEKRRSEIAGSARSSCTPSEYDPFIERRRVPEAGGEDIAVDGPEDLAYRRVGVGGERYVAARSSRTSDLGKIVEAWKEMGLQERRDTSLKLAGVGTQYAFAFKMLPLNDEEARRRDYWRVFYGELKWKPQPLIQSGAVVFDLVAGVKIRVDTSSWSEKRRAAFVSVLDDVRTVAKDVWASSRGSSFQEISSVRVFVFARAEPAPVNTISVSDEVRIYFDVPEGQLLNASLPSGRRRPH